jgi:tetratricopeptide (TPR) repeat protein
MLSEPIKDTIGSVESLAAKGYWPAVAARYLAEGKYSRAVEICRDNLAEKADLLSARLIYARTLYCAGQRESAAEQFYSILAHDPENLVALKFMGDIKNDSGDTVTALSYYRRVLEIDPDCRGLSSPVQRQRRETTQTITLVRQAEPVNAGTKETSELRRIQFYTETIGDLYLAQGHSRMAAEVFRVLSKSNDNPRLAEKLRISEKIIEEKGK